jgi:hypothetical protein
VQAARGMAPVLGPRWGQHVDVGWGWLRSGPERGRLVHRCCGGWMPARHGEHRRWAGCKASGGGASAQAGVGTTRCTDDCGSEGSNGVEGGDGVEGSGGDVISNLIKWFEVRPLLGARGKD